jgi:hypothetical protein
MLQREFMYGHINSLASPPVMLLILEANSQRNVDMHNFAKGFTLYLEFLYRLLKQMNKKHKSW